MNQLIQDYQEHIIKQGLTVKTSKNYTYDVKTFHKWLISKNSTLENFNRYHVLKYLEYIQDNLKTATINKKINSLYHFNQYLIEKNIKENLVIFNDKDRIKDTSAKQVDVFTEAEQEHLLFYLLKDDVDIRVKSVTLILMMTGIRVSELIHIKLKDIDYILNEIVVRGKGNKSRTIPLKPIVIKAIKEYISTERRKSKYAEESEILFVTERAGQPSRDTIRLWIKPLEAVINSKVYPHKFRHNFATNLINKGVEITTVAAILGHSDIQTTIDYYVNTSKENKQKAIDKL